MFITFEGIEGCGKSTQAALLYQALSLKGVSCILTREPGGTRIGRQIRQILMSSSNIDLCPVSELFLIVADRAQHVTEVIRPALAKGGLVICDRFSDATVAYQGYGRGLDLDLIGRLNQVSSGGLCPDKTFLLDCPVETGLRRALGRDQEAENQTEGRFEAESIVFHRKVRQGYLELSQAEPERFVVLDAEESVEDLARKILGVVQGLMESKK